MTLLRHLVAIVALPVTMTILVPLWIARTWAVVASVPSSLPEVLLLLAGVGLLLAGLALFSACLLRFAKQGRGTLAPWDPPSRLVIGGPYRWVRNPMISGVILVLFGEACLLRSVGHTIWAAIFAATTFAVIVLVEEPQLAARFGDEYGRYRENVPRFLPRLRPRE